MLTRKELHRLRGPAQLRAYEADRMFEMIKSFGIISGQPREIFVKPLSVVRDFVYLPETRRANIRGKQKTWDGPIQDWYNAYVRDPGPPIKTNNPKIATDASLWNENVILAVGVHYPATPSTEFYTADGRYRMSTATNESPKELGEQLIELATTPRNELKQTDAGWKHKDEERYYLKTKTLWQGGKPYEVGTGPWFEKSNGRLNEAAIFMESIESAYDTNGHIFFIIGDPRVPQVNFNAINYKVIS